MRKYSSELLGKRLTDEVFGVQPEDMALTVAKSVGLLRHEVPARYARMKHFVDEAWDMAEAMTDRVELLTPRQAS